MNWFARLAPQYRLPQVAIAGSPFLAQHLASSGFIWPPLGSLEVFAAYVATLLIALCSFLPGLIETNRQAKEWFVRSLTACLVAFLIYVVLVGRYVVIVDTPANGAQARSIGFVVEPSIRARFPHENDAQLLKIGGLEDWQIQTVWTPRSVLASRLCILASFSLMLALTNVALGSAARFEKGNN